MDDAIRPLGEPVAYAGARAPSLGTVLHGRTVTLRPLHAGDARGLYAASHPPRGELSIWDYLPDGPFAGESAMADDLAAKSASTDPLFFAVTPAGSAVASGVCSYLRIVPQHGVIEIGHIWFAPGVQRTTAATEAIYLLAGHAFDELGYRRLEWKCNALNAPSRAAARRFGFAFEGVFAQHMVVKGRNRDTAWFAITDARWPAIRDAFETWLAPANFDAAGVQRTRLTVPAA